MTASRLWTLVLALASVVVLALGWMLGVKPQLDAMVLAQQQRAQVEQENIQHGADLVGLRQQFDEIDVLRRELSQLRQAVPEGWDQASVIETVREIAEVGGIEIGSIEWSDALFYVPAASGGPAIPEPEPGAEPEDGDVPDPAAAAAPADASAGVVSVEPADATVLTNSLVAVPVTIKFHARYTDVLTFITRLRDSDRIFLVTGATLAPEGLTGMSSISGLVYVLPGNTP